MSIQEIPKGEIQVLSAAIWVCSPGLVHCEDRAELGPPLNTGSPPARLQNLHNWRSGVIALVAIRLSASSRLGG